ncbi:MAG: hypothetical protein ABSC94_08260 [Polyangiaceae bacterium]
MVETIARLEAEIRDLRILDGGRREQRLIIVASLCALFGICALIACLDARARETWIESQSRMQRDRTSRCTERLSACTTTAEMGRAQESPLDDYGSLGR